MNSAGRETAGIKIKMRNTAPLECCVMHVGGPMDIDKLEKLAMAATKKKWTAFIRKKVVAILADNDAQCPIIEWVGFDASANTVKQQKADARFIEAAQPTVVLELIKRLRELESA